MQLTLLQVLLITAWAGYCSFDNAGPQMLRRPLVVGPIVGLILGNLHESLIISATLELMWMGLGNMAGYRTPDMITGTIIGVTFGITSGQGAEVGVTLAVPTALLTQQLGTLTGTIKQCFTPMVYKLTANGNFKGVDKVTALALFLSVIYRAIPTFLIVYCGNDLINSILAAIPSDVLKGLGVASSMLPAIGLAILMDLLIKKGIWLFILLGFVLTAYLELPIIAITIIGIIFGYLYDLASYRPTATANITQVEDEEEEIDL